MSRGHRVRIFQRTSGAFMISRLPSICIHEGGRGIPSLWLTNFHSGKRDMAPRANTTQTNSKRHRHSHKRNKDAYALFDTHANTDGDVIRKHVASVHTLVSGRFKHGVRVRVRFVSSELGCSEGETVRQIRYVLGRTTQSFDRRPLVSMLRYVIMLSSAIGGSAWVRKSFS